MVAQVKDDVVPPKRGGNGEMCNVRAKNRLVVFHFKPQRLTSVTIRCWNHRVSKRAGRSFPLEELHSFLVLLRRRPRFERAKIPSLPSFRVLLP
jgi:hypothetical protein